MGNSCSYCCSCCGEDKSSNALYEPLLQENEKEAVADLLQFLENRSESIFFEGEPLRALTTLSYSNNVDLQRSAALAFAEITERHVEEVESAVLEPLLFLLKESNDVEVQRAASAALGNLAVCMGNKPKIVRLGGLPPLIQQMSSPNVEVQCNAVGCITNLATHEENKSAIAKSGALLPLTKLARFTKDIRVQRNATGALLNMTHSEENRKELVEIGAIPVLVSLLKSSDSDVVYYCTTAISNLAVDALNRNKLLTEPRLVPELIDLMDSQSIKVQCQAALALRNLASDDSFQLEIANHPQGLPRLKRLLSGLSSPSSSQVHPQLILAAVACIRNISIHQQNEDKIIDSGFLKPLVHLLSSENEEIQCHAISTLRNLAAGTSAISQPNQKDNKEKIVESGALEKVQKSIEQCMKEGVVPQTNLYRISWPVLGEMIAFLAVLALSDRLKVKLIRANMIQTMLPLIQPSIPSEIQGNAAACLGNLATKAPEMEPFIKQWDGISKYLERFLEPLPSHIGTHYHEQDEASGTFQHIAIWTILQFCEKGDPILKKIQSHPRLPFLIKNLNSVNHDEEVSQLTNRVLSYLGSDSS